MLVAAYDCVCESDCALCPMTNGSNPPFIKNTILFLNACTVINSVWHLVCFSYFLLLFSNAVQGLCDSQIELIS